MPEDSTGRSIAPESHAKDSCACKHCGTTFKSKRKTELFCCNGCEYVYHLINHAGLEQFYSLKGKEIQPIGTRAFKERELVWLDTLVAAEEAKGNPTSKLKLDLQGISCVGCVWLLEKLFNQSEGAIKTLIHPESGTIELTWSTGKFDIIGFAREIQKFGYSVGPYQERAKQKNQGLSLRIGLCGAFAMNSMLFTLPFYLGMEETNAYAWLFQFLTFVFASLSAVTGGSYFFRRSYQSLIRGIIHIDLPISLGIGFAYIGSVIGWYFQEASLLYFDFVSIFTFLMLSGRWIQEYAVEKNRNYLLERNPVPDHIETVDGLKVQLDHIEPGLDFVLKPGHIVPVNAQLVSASASVNLEWINGESEPVSIRRFQNLPSGAINASSKPLELNANEHWDNSLMHTLLHSESTESYAPTLLTKVLKIYLLAVLVISTSGGTLWYLTTQNLLLSWQVTLSILVVSCPCALGVAAPLADELAAGRLKRLGVFIRDRLIWGKLRKVHHIVFDKTGTLTLEAPDFQNQEVLDTLSNEERSVLYHMVGNNLHPRSRSLKQALLSRFHEELSYASQKQNDTAEEVLGKGLVLKRENDTWKLGRADWAIATRNDSEQASTLFSINDQLIASFDFADAVREDAAEELHQLRQAGYDIELLSGDHPERVTDMLKQLGLPPSSGRGHQSPQQKAAHVESLRHQGTLMVGDGANDSLAFDAALCCGTPVIEKGILEQKADFYFLGRKLAGIRELLHVGHEHFKAVRDVFLFAISYNLIAIIICLSGNMNPLLAAVLMPLSSLISLSLVTLRLRGRKAQ